jgi:mono/diheme cytochrome c family protein
MDTGMLHTHKLVVSLYLLQLLVRVILMVASKKETVEKYTKAMRIPHIVLSILMLGTGIYLMVRTPTGTQPYIFVKLGLMLASIPLGIIGSKRSSVPLTGLAFLLLAGTMAIAFVKPAFLRSTTAVTVDAGDANAASLKEGKAVFEAKCYLCHGADGRMGFQGAKDLHVSVLEDDAIMEIIRHGKGRMPANNDLSDAEVQNLKDYVKYLRK